MGDIFNTTLERYELIHEGHTAYATYRKENTTLYIDYVFSPPELRGTGAAGRLMQYIVECANAEGLKIVPICNYATAWLKRH